MSLLQPSAAGPARASDDITVDKIFESLRARIVSGQIAPGTVINSVEIASHFGTSRTPVREALLLLGQYGLVTLAARRRPRVSDVSAKAIRDLYALRTALHACLAQAIVQAAPDAALQVLRARALELIEAFDSRSTEAHLVDVEAYLGEEVRLGDNEVVAGVLDSLKWRIAWFRRLGSLSREQLKGLAMDRLRVADAYLDRDARLAEALNRSMLKKTGDYCEQNFLNALTAAAAIDR